MLFHMATNHERQQSCRTLPPQMMYAQGNSGMNIQNIGVGLTIREDIAETAPHQN